MSQLKNKAWVHKYKPTSLSEYIFQNSKHEQLVNTIIEENMPGHILLMGIQGTGKTSLSNILIHELGINPSDVLRINASDENSIDIIRNKVISFISTIPHGDYKVVQMEEADHISINGQSALRVVLEEYADSAKFIFTCNYGHKIIPALKSRCTHQLEFKSPDKPNVMKRVIQILLNEKVKFDPDLITKYVDICYPDLRKIIQTVQQNTINGELVDPSEIESNDDYKLHFLELLETDNWSEIRNIICQQVSNDEIESVYRFLYENLHKSKKFQKTENWESGQVMIAEYLYKDAIVTDREINLSALFINLGKI